MTTRRGGQRRVHLPSLAAELPDGWSVSERATCVSPTGTQFHVRLDLAPDGLTASELADRSERTARDELGPCRSVEATTVVVRGGRIAHVRQLDHDGDGVAGSARIASVVEGHCALVVTVRWAAGGGDPSAEMDELVGGVRLLSRPLLHRDPSAGSDAPARSPTRRPPVDEAVWTGLQAAWRVADAAGATDDGVPDLPIAGRWSQEELAVGATIVGAPSFPTVGPELLGGLTEPELDATLGAVTRSFLARGLVRAEAGRAVLDDELRRMIELAVQPDLSVAVDRFAPGDARTAWFGVRPDAAVRIVACSDGSRDCGHLVPRQLIDQILFDAGVERSPAAVGGRPARRVVAVDDFVAGDDDVAAIVRISTAWRSGDGIVGGVVTWAAGHDGSWWFADLDATPGSAVLEQADAAGLRAQLLEHLPGA